MIFAVFASGVMFTSSETNTTIFFHLTLNNHENRCYLHQAVVSEKHRRQTDLPEKSLRGRTADQADQHYNPDQ
jgi:hypothetical protein